MDLSDARAIAETYLDKVRESCPVEIEFNDSVTEEHPIGYVFFYNTKEYWKTRDFSKSLAGNGPVLVKRETGEIVVLPSNQSVKKSLNALRD